MRFQQINAFYFLSKRPKNDTSCKFLTEQFLEGFKRTKLINNFPPFFALSFKGVFIQSTILHSFIYYWVRRFEGASTHSSLVYGMAREASGIKKTQTWKHVITCLTLIRLYLEDVHTSTLLSMSSSPSMIPWGSLSCECIRAWKALKVQSET